MNDSSLAVSGRSQIVEGSQENGHAATPQNGSEIAVLAMPCRFPGAASLAEYWDKLAAGRETITRFSDEELLKAGVERSLLGRADYVKANGALAGIDQFDAAFFDFAKGEAELLDPQHRLFLEIAWQALEEAGYNPETTDALIGVYAGASMSTYLLYNLAWTQDLSDPALYYLALIANDKDFLATRVSYKLKLRGPSVTVQTACSTSLVAVHVACQALLNGECDIALAGGVSVRVPQEMGYVYQDGMVLSPDGHCRAFDAAAAGIVGGSGVGVVVLKRLAEAVAAGDPIVGVIKGSAINNDGGLKVGFTAPSVAGQAAVINEAQAIAGVEPDSVSYIEAHGTGTPLGDPIEIAALTEAFRVGTSRRGFCALGSVKTNIGHVDAAAGVAGLIKTLLALQHKQLPPSLHFERPNPQIDFATSPFYVNTELREWRAEAGPRRAGVSSFGIGGTNAHVIVEEAPERAPSGPGRRWQPVVLSARTRTALERATANLATELERQPDLKLADVAFTLATGRQAFTHRRVVVGERVEEALNALRGEGGPVDSGEWSEGQRPVVFLFPGQGAQYVGMGQGLYREEERFRTEVDRCAELLTPRLGFDLRQVLYPSAGEAAAAAECLTETAVAQVGLFVTEYALAQLWMGWGVQPQVMVGHSVGEYVAATVAGVFELEAALRVVAERGRLMQQAPRGAMVAVSASEAELLPLLREEVSIAAINGPQVAVVGGPPAAIQEFEGVLTAHGLVGRRLRTSHAFHTAMMEGMLPAFGAYLEGLPLRPPKVPYISSRTGAWISEREATDPQYWVKQAREPVRFEQGLRTVLQDPNLILVEVGPGTTLAGLAQRHPARGVERVVLTSLGRASDSEPDSAHLMTSLGQVWVNGGGVDWQAVYRGEQRHRVPLPSYPFERQRYWVEPPSQATKPTPLSKNGDIGEWFWVPSWRRTAIPPQQVAAGAKTYVVFQDEAGIGAGVGARLREAGQSVITVQRGDRFRRVDETTFTVCPGAAEEYEELWTVLGQADRLPHAIVHVWSVTAGEDAAADDRELQERGVFSLLYLAQALGHQGAEAAVELTVVSDGLHEVVGGERIEPTKALLLGPLKVIPQELGQVRCRSLDIEDGAAAEEAIEQVYREVQQPGGDRVVAYRRGHRWVQGVERVALPPVTGLPAVLRERGVYLITGGLGGLGLSLASYLAQQCQARLLLTSRTPFPPRDQWEQLPDDDPRRDSITKLKAVEAQGAEVLIWSANVADRQGMEIAIADAETCFGPLNGVIHAAGIAGDGVQSPLPTTTLAQCQEVFRAKVQGTRVLAELLAGRNVDFVALMSSLASQLGGLSFTAYAAANLYLDAFAISQNQRQSSPWVAINWDGWQSGRTGLALPQTALLINESEGQEAFGRVMDWCNPGQILVSTSDLQARIEQWISLKPPAVGAPQRKKEQLILNLRTSREKPYTAPRTALEHKLAEIWQDLLGVEPISMDDNFFDLGGDSLLATQILSRTKSATGIDVPLRTVFDDPTIGALAAAMEATQNRTPEPIEMSTTAEQRVELEI